MDAFINQSSKAVLEFNISTSKTEDIEIQLLLEAIYLKYGYDFRAYARPTLKRRINLQLEKYQLSSVSELQNRLLYDAGFFEELLTNFSINVTSMFRTPSFYQELRSTIAPILEAEDSLRIWSAGCATGEETYSLAILLTECGLYDRSTIYATDISEHALKKAATGIFSLADMQKFTRQYQLSGGENSLSDYFISDNKNAIIRSSLKDNIVFSDHNLVTDNSLPDMNLILCRNVLIYFNSDLQKLILDQFHHSLLASGFLGLGSMESIVPADHGNKFRLAIESEKIYQSTRKSD